MANSLTNQPDNTGGTLSGSGLKTTPEAYVSLATLIEPNKPDVRDLYVQTFGDQGITGFLDLTGAKKNAGAADKVTWYEEGRLHKTAPACTWTASGGALAGTGIGDAVRINDVLLLKDGQRVVV